LQPRKDTDEEKQGEIKHIYRNWAFVYSRKHPLNGGIFVCKTRQLQLVGGVKTADSMSAPALDTSDLLKSPHPLESPRPFGGGATPGQHSASSVSGGQSVHGDRGGFNRGGGKYTDARQSQFIKSLFVLQEPTA
jgi:transcription elongation factor SPT5